MVAAASANSLYVAAIVLAGPAALQHVQMFRDGFNVLDSKQLC